MLDGKILAAVLATLTAVAATGTGGDVQKLDVTNPNSIDASPSSIINDPIGKVLEMVRPTPEADDEVKATLKVENIVEETFKLERGTITPQNTTEMRLGTKNIRSDEEIQLYGYAGTVKPGNTTSFSGSIDGVVTSGVNVSGTSSISRTTEAKAIIIENAKLDSIKLSGVSGKIDSEYASTTFNESNSQKLRIRSFEGDMKIYPGNNTLVLNGKVGTLSLGSFSFGN